MKQLTVNQFEKLRKNGRDQYFSGLLSGFGPRIFNYPPVAKLYDPKSKAIWLLSSINFEDEDKVYCLYDLGAGSPKLGHVSLKKLEKMPIVCDLEFVGTKPITHYEEDAKELGYIGV